LEVADYSFSIYVHGEDIIVFIAGYYKPPNQPRLVLRHRTQTDDYGLLAAAWQAANDKARELGWIV
jgi:hypothetical protein